MEIEKYGVKLTRLTLDKIELVRQWRNSENIRRFMIFQQEITPLMQQRWFERINNESNYYFVLSFEGDDIGLSNIKDIDPTHKQGECGLFIADHRYLDTDIPVRIAMCGLDWCFEHLSLEETYISVAKFNYKAKSSNNAFGYRLLEGEDNKDFQRYVLTKEWYFQHRTNLIKMLWE